MALETWYSCWRFWKKYLLRFCIRKLKNEDFIPRNCNGQPYGMLINQEKSSFNAASFGIILYPLSFFHLVYISKPPWVDGKCPAQTSPWFLFEHCELLCMIHSYSNFSVLKRATLENGPTFQSNPLRELPPQYTAVASFLKRCKSALGTWKSM